MSAAPRSMLAKMTSPPESILCPFTGNEISLQRTADGLFWYGVVEMPFGGYTTSLFRTREKLLFFLGHEAGVKPGYPEVPRIEVTELKPPPVTNDAEEAEKDRSLEDASFEFAEKVKFEHAGRGSAGLRKAREARSKR